jgi:hypothetical protein
MVAAVGRNNKVGHATLPAEAELRDASGAGGNITHVERYLFVRPCVATWAISSVGFDVLSAQPLLFCEFLLFKLSNGLKLLTSDAIVPRPKPELQAGLLQ